MDSVTGITLPQALRGDAERAVEHLRRYYSARLESVPEDERMLFDGAFFDHWGPEDPNPNVFTAEDVVALQCLGTPLRTWSAAVKILHQETSRLSELLIEIGHDRDLATVPAEEITPEWPAWRLDSALQKITGIGPVVASKLVARKRPNLYPIQDTQIRRLTGLSASDFLRPFHREWTGNQALQERLVDVCKRAGLEGRISLLRTFDVVAWMEQRGIDRGEETTGPFSRILL